MVRAMRTTRTGRDLVDSITDDWRTEMPELDRPEYELARRATRLGLLLADALTRCLGPWDLTSAEYGVLIALRSVGAPYELRPSDLKARLLLTSGGVSNVLNRLAKSGLIERQRDAKDGRSSWVRLTEAGVETAESAVHAWSDAQREMFRAVSPDTARAAADALREVLLALGDGEPPVPQLHRQMRARLDARER
jgi:DNA-binding MarR family transcriptional regulator